MARWVVMFDDTPGMLEHRKQYGTDHIEYLKDHADEILVGGGLRITPDTPFVGGLWIVDATDYDRVVSLVLNDPYFNPDHRRFKIFSWGKAIDADVTL